MFKPPFNWFNKFGTLPATYKEAMSYEEQIMWLCKEVQRNESYAEEFQAVIDEINESITKIDSDIDDSKMIKKLKEDLHLVDSLPDTGLLDGLYFSDGHKVYVNNVEQPLFNNALFYVDENGTLYLIYSAGYYHQNLNFYEIYYNRETNSWNFGYYNPRTNWENVFDRPSINNFTQDLNLVDGTGTTGLADGIYFTDNYKVYINGVESNFFNHAVILSYSSNSLYVISSPYNARQPLGFYEVYYNSSSNTWNTGYQGMQTDWSLVNNKPSINNLTQDLNLVDETGTTGLIDGLYFSDGHKVYVNNVEQPLFNNALFYAEGNDTLYLICSSGYYRQHLNFYEIYYYRETNSWNFGYYSPRTDWSLINNKPAGMENYSTNEQVVGTWIDNKPLYQKVLTGICPTYSTSTIITDIDIASDVDFAFIENQFVVSSVGSCFTLPRSKYYAEDTGVDVVDNSTTGSIYGNTKKYRLKQNSTNVNGYTYYAVIRYTKTTD